MTVRKLLALVMLTLPVLLAAWAQLTINAGEVMIPYETPRYADISAQQMAAELSKDQLAAVATNTMSKYKQMEGLWQAARANDHRVFIVLLVAVAILSVGLFVLLWRSPGQAPSEGAQ